MKLLIRMRGGVSDKILKNTHNLTRGGLWRRASTSSTTMLGGLGTL